MAGHDFMDFRYGADGKMTGGSDGCINFNDPDNAGLPNCIREFDVATAYESVCDRVSLADFVVIAGEAVMARTATSYNSKDKNAPGSLAKLYRDQFKHGRKTNLGCNNPVGLMPSPELGCNGLKAIFHEHIFRETG